MTLDFTPETVKASRNNRLFVKCWKKKTIKSQVHPVKKKVKIYMYISCRNVEQVKAVSNEGKLKEFVTLKEWLFLMNINDAKTCSMHYWLEKLLKALFQTQTKHSDKTFQAFEVVWRSTLNTSALTLPNCVAIKLKSEQACFFCNLFTIWCHTVLNKIPLFSSQCLMEECILELTKDITH